jgi:Tol biopolymer transport system component
VNGDLLAFQKGKASRKLASGVAGVTFGMDASTVYAVKIARAGTNDTATILAIDFASGTTSTLTTITMAHPASVARSRLNAARFFDDGGADRLYPTSDGNLVLWVDNGGQWRIDPASGSNVPVTRQPVLWSPDGTRRISVAESGTTTTLTLVDTTGAKLASVQMSGLISHLRWSPSGKQVMFTAGLAFSSGGVRMDLWTWDLVNGKKPRQLTSNGASWGAEWLGVAQFWQP